MPRIKKFIIATLLLKKFPDEEIGHIIVMKDAKNPIA